MTFDVYEGQIFVGNIPRGIKKREIEDIFQKFGQIKNVDIRDNKYGETCFAFIEFDEKSRVVGGQIADDMLQMGKGMDKAYSGKREFSRAAELSVSSRNGYDFMGYRLRVDLRRVDDRYRGRQPPTQFPPHVPRFRAPLEERRPPPPKSSGHRLMVLNLPRTCNWQDLKDFFRDSGEITYTVVFRNHTGMVEFSRKEDMDWTLKTMHNKKLESHEGEISIVDLRPAYPSTNYRIPGRPMGPVPSPPVRYKHRDSPGYYPERHARRSSRGRSPLPRSKARRRESSDSSDDSRRLKKRRSTSSSDDRSSSYSRSPESRSPSGSRRPRESSESGSSRNSSVNSRKRRQVSDSDQPVQIAASTSSGGPKNRLETGPFSESCNRSGDSGSDTGGPSSIELHPILHGQLSRLPRRSQQPQHGSSKSSSSSDDMEADHNGDVCDEDKDWTAGSTLARNPSKPDDGRSSDHDSIGVNSKEREVEAGKAPVPSSSKLHNQSSSPTCLHPEQQPEDVVEAKTPPQKPGSPADFQLLELHDFNANVLLNSPIPSPDQTSGAGPNPRADWASSASAASQDSMPDSATGLSQSHPRRKLIRTTRSKPAFQQETATLSSSPIVRSLSSPPTESGAPLEAAPSFKTGPAQVRKVTLKPAEPSKSPTCREPTTQPIRELVDLRYQTLSSTQLDVMPLSTARVLPTTTTLKGRSQPMLAPNTEPEPKSTTPLTPLPRPVDQFPASKTPDETSPEQKRRPNRSRSPSADSCRSGGSSSMETVSSDDDADLNLICWMPGTGGR